MENPQPTNIPRVSTEKEQSWGALIAIFVVLAMVVLGAFYAWNKRVSREQILPVQSSAATATSAIASTTTNTQ